MREFLPGLEEKYCAHEDMVKGTGLEHWKYLINDVHTDSLGYWSLIINLGQ